MRIKKVPLTQVRTKVQRAWSKKWVRWTLIGCVVLGAFGGGTDTNDPRTEQNRPHLATPEEMLYGKWDGIATLPDGTVFCMAQWPCEDQIGK